MSANNGPLITAGPGIQKPSHNVTPAPTPLSYLPDRPAPGSFGIINSPPAATPTNYAAQGSASQTTQDIPRSWFTGCWPVLPTSYAIEKGLVPEPPALIGQYYIRDDPMNIDHRGISVLPSNLGNINPNSQTLNSQPLQPNSQTLQPNPQIPGSQPLQPNSQTPNSQPLKPLQPLKPNSQTLGSQPLQVQPNSQTPDSQKRRILPASLSTAPLGPLSVLGSSMYTMSAESLQRAMVAKLGNTPTVVS